MEGLDEFEKEVELMDLDAEDADDVRVFNCSCKDVIACPHFEQNNGKVLKFYDDEAEGSGCGGAWDSDYSQAILYIDRFDGNLMIAYVAWNDCSCYGNDLNGWWKEDLADLPDPIDDYLIFAPNTDYEGKYASKFIQELERDARVVSIIRDMIGARRYRKESILSKLPKEVLIIILQKVWTDADDE